MEVNVGIKRIVESSTNHHFDIWIAVDRKRRVAAKMGEDADIVESHHMIGMVMRHEDGVGVAEAFSQELLTKVGAGVNENSTSRGGDEGTGPRAMKFGIV